MKKDRISVLHHLQGIEKSEVVENFLGSILKGKSGSLDLVFVNEILSDIDDRERRRLAEKRRKDRKLLPSKEVIKRAETNFSKYLPDYYIKSRSISGDPVNIILERIGESNYDLLSLEAYGRGGFHKNILGVHVTKIIQKSPLPTIVTKGRHNFCERVLVNIPHDKERCVKLLYFLSDILRGTDIEITLLVVVPEEKEKFVGYISSEEEELLESIENYPRDEVGYLGIAKEIMTKKGLEYEAKRRVGEVTEEIFSETKGGKYDLLAFYPGKSSIFESIWSGDKSLNMMQDIEISFLKLPREDN